MSTSKASPDLAFCETRATLFVVNKHKFSGHYSQDNIINNLTDDACHHMRTLRAIAGWRRACGRPPARTRDPMGCRCVCRRYTICASASVASNVVAPHTHASQGEAKPGTACNTHIAGEMSKLPPTTRFIISAKVCWNTSTKGRPARAATNNKTYVVFMFLENLFTVVHNCAVLGT
jgi:hypothetical protein